MNIEGRICRLRALEPADLDAMYGWENDTHLWRVSGTLAPFSRHALSRFIDEQQFDIYATRQLRLVVESRHGERVGAVDLFEFDPQHRRAGVGIVIDPKFQRLGYALDALNTLEGYVRGVLNMRQLWCSVTEDNLASQQLFTRAGYCECGRRKGWYLTPDGELDEILFQKIL